MSKDEQDIDTLLTRGVENIYPNKEEVKKKLLAGETLRIYLGIDPTGPTLHIGHGIILRKLQKFQEKGHEIVLLIGDFTATIGDPTGKNEVRVPLTREQVLENAEKYKDQASLFLDFEGDNPTILKYNSTWLDSMTFGDVVQLASNMTVQEMLKRDMFKRRMDAERPIYIHEFLYPLMQGYDSVAMEVDGEIGGNDQVFNMLAGRTLERQILNKDKFVIGMELLVDSSGKKMGKSEGNMVTFEDDPSDMFGKVMSWTDEMIIPGFTLCSDLPQKEINAIQSAIEEGENPRDFKVQLAHTIVATYHGEEKADDAQKDFNNTFAQGGVPDDAPTVSVVSGTALADVLTDNEVVESKTQFRRLIDQGAVKDATSGSAIEQYDAAVESSITVRVGKHRFLRIEVKE